LDVLASGMIGSGGGGGISQGLLQFLELCGRREPITRLVALLVEVVSTLDVSPDGDDTMRSLHFLNQVGIVRNYHELGEC
jgi:hypothetical protein